MISHGQGSLVDTVGGLPHFPLHMSTCLARVRGESCVICRASASASASTTHPTATYARQPNATMYPGSLDRFLDAQLQMSSSPTPDMKSLVRKRQMHPFLSASQHL